MTDKFAHQHEQCAEESRNAIPANELQ
jgi:hypothetical protein